MKSNQISIIVASLILGISFIIGRSLIDFQTGSKDLLLNWINDAS